MFAPSRPTARFVRHPRSPQSAPPAHSIDAQAHVFGPVDRYPARPGGGMYDPPVLADLEAMLAMHRALGIERGVIVHASVYGTNNRLLLDALPLAGPNYRGVALIDDAVSDRELEQLHAAGVRGARFNFWKALNAAPDPAEFLRSVERVRALGWFIKVFAQPDELRELMPLLRKAQVPIVLDHMACLDVSKPLDNPDARYVLDLLADEKWWIMLSNGDRLSAGPPHDDAVAYARAMIAVAPDRTVWGSDWPHLREPDDEPHEDAELIELMYRYAPDDAARRNVLVDNPARLFGFGDST